MTINTTVIRDTILVATSTGSMGASHTGLGVYEYGFSMRGNTLGVSTHREPFSYTPWGFPGILHRYLSPEFNFWKGIFSTQCGFFSVFAVQIRTCSGCEKTREVNESVDATYGFEVTSSLFVPFKNV